jgi:NAD(P)H-hydrate epimerase
MKDLTAEDMEELDRRLVEEHGLSVERLMENAGYQLADFIRRRYPRDPLIRIYIGPGNNGGDAAIAARRLHNWGFRVQTRTAGELREESLEELRHVTESEGEDPDVLVDGLLGFGIDGDPRPPFDELVEEINQLESDTVSVDIATGLDPDTGEEAEPCVEPDSTVSMAAPFQGMDEDNSGEIWVADISVPREELEEMDAEDFFLRGSVKRITR